MLKLIKFLSPYKGRVTVMLILLFLQVLGTLYIPTLTADIVNHGIVTGNPSHIWKTGSLMLAVAASIAVVSLTETYLSTAIFSRMGRDIRNTLFEKSQALTIDQFNRFGPASMITRSTNDIMQIQMAYMAGTEMILPAPIMAIAGLILAFSKSPSLAAVIILSMLIVCIFTVLLALKVMPLFSKLQTLLDKINRTLREMLTGIRMIRAFNRVNEMLAVNTDTAISVQKIKKHIAKAKLEFRNVTFQYQGAEEPVLNHILVMRDGTLIEQGSHDELVKLGKFYADLYNSPFSSLPSSANLV